VEPGPEAVVISVRNTRPRGPSTGRGTARGLTGLRERVQSIGGSVTWGALEDGGFEVRASLPAFAEVSR
jgi:glucose-6-phosphate-specific signal transduction histidine kinase